MKQTTKVLMCTLCVAALLSGCGQTQKPSASASASSGGTSSSAEKQDLSASLELLRAANSLNALTDRHTAIYFTDEYYQGAESAVPDSAVAGQYFMENGHLQMIYKYSDRDGTVHYSQGHGDDTYAAALYECGPQADDQKYMTLFYDEDSYRTALAARWDLTDDVQETVVSDELRDDGTREVTTQSKASEEDPSSTVAVYTVDGDTYEIQAYTATTYDETGAEVAKVQHSVIYDTPQTFEFSPFEAIIGGKDYCELSVICDPQQDDMRVNWYPVAHDTDVSFSDVDAYTLYGDEDLTQKLDPLSSIDVSGAAQNVFVVPNT